MKPYVGAIEELALRNGYFRQVLFTGQHAHLVVMSLLPGEEIGEETHAEADQFLRIERGEARLVFDGREDHLVHDGAGVVVPAGTRHNVINASKTALLQLFTIYSPSNHPDQAVHKTKAEAEVAEAVHA